MTLYVTGGRQRRKYFAQEEEARFYERALILGLHLETHTVNVCVSYESPHEVCTDETPSILFKTGTLDGSTLYIPTSTEVLIYEVPDFKRLGYISISSFNDIHHARPTPEGNVLVVSTGLDMVVEVTREGRVLREWNVLGENPWERFSRTIDYRKVASTKPHKSHPNFVFFIGNDVWVTRSEQHDVINLTSPGQPIKLSTEYIHDGHLYANRLHFTSVDGRVIIVDQTTLEIVEEIDLKKIDNEENALLGWCRGVLPLDERRIWVGFTRIRKTKFQEKINWVKHVFHDSEKPTHIALYDLVARKRLAEVDLEPFGMSTVFSMFQTAE
jgi:hypothetical protein